MRPRGHHRPSSIDRLDPEVRDLIGRLRIDKGYTIDEIRAQLEKMLVAELVPSRSALGRHVRTVEDIGADLRRAREMAIALSPAAGEGDEDRLVELNIEIMQSMIFKMQTAVDEDGIPVVFSPQEAMLASKAIQQSVAARKSNADFILKIRKETSQAAAETVRAAVKARGLGKETADFLYDQVLGVAS